MRKKVIYRINNCWLTFIIEGITEKDIDKRIKIKIEEYDIDKEDYVVMNIKPKQKISFYRITKNRKIMFDFYKKWY